MPILAFFCPSNGCIGMKKITASSLKPLSVAETIDLT
jgi:hypothetical protein